MDKWVRQVQYRHLKYDVEFGVYILNIPDDRNSCLVIVNQLCYDWDKPSL